MTNCTPAEPTQLQIAELRLDRAKPLIICDVDEVVVHFIAGLERYLQRNDLWLDPASFALNGNIKHNRSGAPVTTDELRGHFTAFFDQEIHRLDPIDGAATSLSAMAGRASIVMLTNLPDRYRTARMENLARHGMPYPVITNQGPKGPAVRAITSGHDAPIVFIDDIPNYLRSVHDHCPQVHLVHFMQDKRFGRHSPKLDYVSLRADNWTAAHSHISRLVGA